MSKFRFFMLLTLLPFTCFASSSVPSINDIMSIEDQTATGVIRLTQQQKMLLAKWLVQHGCYDPAGADYSKVTVSINISDGQILQLSDNSVWEIDPADQGTSQLWLSAIPISISESTSKDYPYLLTNIKTQASVKARKRGPL